MREIKFRAWNPKISKMEFKFMIPSTGDGYSGIMQFTGLKDVNGKEIYEGDIVETDGKKREVRFNEGMWKIDGLVLAHWEVEIIGNIYENPELLANL